MAATLWAGRKWILVFAFQGAFSSIAGCAGIPNTLPSDSGHRSPPPVYEPVDKKPRKFSASTAMDTLLTTLPIPLPEVVHATVPDSGKTTTTSKPPDPIAPTGTFQIQVDALSGMDAAQTRKAVLEAKLGIKMEMIFDPPYYKLRFGSFTSRAEAEDKLLELAQKNVQGFIVRQ